MGTEHLSFNWENRQKELFNVFQELRVEEDLVDVTVACDGISFEAHKMVLSACSPYFRTLFQKNRCKHPIVIMANVKYRDMKAIIDFMYNGEVNVPLENVAAFLEMANFLKVKGLAVTEVSGSEDVMDVRTNDSLSTLRENIPQLESTHEPTRQQLSRSNSSVNSDNGCSQEDVSAYTNESELMESVIVKNEPEDNYCESPNMDTRDNNIAYDNSSSMPRTSSSQPEMGSRKTPIGVEQDIQKSRSSLISEAFTLGSPFPSTEVTGSSESSALAVCLLENITPEHSQDQRSDEILIPDTSPEVRTSLGAASRLKHNQGTGSQTLVSFEEPTVLVNYGVPVNEPSTSSTPINTESETGITHNEEDYTHKESGPSSVSVKRRLIPYQNNLKRKQLRINYTQVSKFGKSLCPRKRILSKSLNTIYDCKCTLKCAEKLPVETRMEIFKKFWRMKNCKEQDAFIRDTVSEMSTGVSSTGNKYKRNYKRKLGRVYTLGGVTICYQMYTNVVRVNTYRINNALQEPKPFRNSINIKHKAKSAVQNTQNSGVAKPTETEKYRLPASKISEVINYFHEFFNYASHSGNKQIPTEYVISNLPLKKLYKVYVQATELPVTYYYFARIFKEDFLKLSRNKSNKDTSCQVNSNNSKAKRLESTSGTQSINSFLSEERRDKDNETSRQNSSACAEHLPSTIDSVSTSLEKPRDREIQKKSKLYKVGQGISAYRVAKVIDHFNKYFNTHGEKTDACPSNNEFLEMYKIYKKGVNIPVPFKSYIKIFNTNYKHSLNQKSDIQNSDVTNAGSKQQNTAYNRKSATKCSTNEMAAVKKCSIGARGRKSIASIPADKIKEVIDHFNAFLNNASYCKRVGISSSALKTDPPLWKMYNVYRKDVSVPISFPHYTKIFNTNFKHSKRGRKKGNTGLTPVHSLYDHVKCKYRKESANNMPSKKNAVAIKVHNSNKDQHQENPITVTNSVLEQRSVASEQSVGVSRFQSSLTSKGRPQNTVQTSKNDGQEAVDNVPLCRIREVINHFREFHNFVSSHNKSNMPLEFVNNNLPLMKMYKIYRSAAIDPVSYHHYFNIFRTNFKQPKNDQENFDKSKDQQNKTEATDKLSRRSSEVNNSVGQYKASSSTRKGETQKSKIITTGKTNKGESKRHDSIIDNKCQKAIICLDKVEIPLRFQNSELNSNSSEVCSSDDSSRSYQAECVEAEKVKKGDELPQTADLNVSSCISGTSNNKEIVSSHIVQSNDSIHSEPVNLLSENDTTTELHKSKQSFDQQNISNGHRSEIPDAAVTSELLTEMIDTVEADSAVVDDPSYIANPLCDIGGEDLDTMPERLCNRIDDISLDSADDDIPCDSNKINNKE